MKTSTIKTKGRGGFSFVEVLVAMTAASIAVLALCSLLVFTVKQNGVSADITVLTALAQDKMEEFKDLKYDSLVVNGNAGSIISEVSGYSDHPGDFYQRFWQIDVDAPATNMATISVRVVSSRELLGAPKECEVMLVRSR